MLRVCVRCPPARCTPPQSQHPAKLDTLRLLDLRKYGSLVGLTNNFVIADRDASLSLIKRLKPAVLDEFKADLKPAKLLELISSCKSKNMSPDMYRRTAVRSRGSEAASRIDAVADVYELYQEELESIQAVDFDDILLYG